MRFNTKSFVLFATLFLSAIGWPPALAELTAPYNPISGFTNFLHDTDFQTAPGVSLPDGIPDTTEDRMGPPANRELYQTFDAYERAVALSLKKVSFQVESGFGLIHYPGAAGPVQSPFFGHLDKKPLVQVAANVASLPTDPAWVPWNDTLRIENLPYSNDLTNTWTNLPDPGSTHTAVYRLMTDGLAAICVTATHHFASFVNTDGAVLQKATNTVRFTLYRAGASSAFGYVRPNTGQKCEPVDRQEGDPYEFKITLTNEEKDYTNRIKLMLYVSEPGLPKLVMHLLENSSTNLACVAETIGFQMEAGSFNGPVRLGILPKLEGGAVFAANGQAEWTTSNLQNVQILPGTVGGNYTVWVWAEDHWNTHHYQYFDVYKLSGIEMENPKVALKVGESRLFRPVWSPAGFPGTNIIFSVKAEAESSAAPTPIVESTPMGDGTLLVHIHPKSAPGHLSITAKWPGVECQTVTTGFPFGCPVDAAPTCSAALCAARPTPKIMNEGFDLSFPVGQMFSGRPAGNLSVKREDPAVELFTPGIIDFGSASPGVESIRHNGHLHQVVSSDQMVEISPVTSQSFDVKYYPRSALAGGREMDGRYIRDGTPPTRVWRVANASGSTNDVSEMQLIQDPDGEAVSIRIKQLGPGHWLRTEGITPETPQGLRTTEITRSVQAGKTNVLVTVRGPDQAIVKQTNARFINHPVSGKQLERLEENAGNGEWLITRHEYHADSGLPSFRVGPDGNWTRWFYDAENRITEERRPWLDLSTTNSLASSCHVFEYSYIPVVAENVGGNPKYTREFRKRTEKIQNSIVSTQARSFALIDNPYPGSIQIITETLTSHTAVFGHSANSRTLEIFYPSDFPSNSGWFNREAGKIYIRRTPDGKFTRSFYYITDLIDSAPSEADWWYGPYNESSDDTLIVTINAYAPNNNSSTNSLGVANYSTWNVKVLDEFERVRLVETYAYGTSFTAPLFYMNPPMFSRRASRIGLQATTRDAEGRTVKVADQSGQSEFWTHNCCGIASHTAADGTVREFEYDGLKRRTLVETLDYPATGQVHRVRHVYDAANRLTGVETTAGGVSSTESSVFDPAGRLTSSVDAAGNIRTWIHQAPARITTLVLPPSGSALVAGNIITTYHSNGFLKSRLGSAAPPLHKEYGVSTGQSWEYERYSTSPAGSPFQFTLFNAKGFPRAFDSPTISNRLFRVNRLDDAFNWPTRFIPQVHGGGLPAFTFTRGHRIVRYDSDGNVNRTGIDIDVNNDIHDISSDPLELYTHNYQLISNHWWRVTKSETFATHGSATKTLLGNKRTRLTGLGVGGLAAEEWSTDNRGNSTFRRVYVDRAARKTTTVVDLPGVAGHVVETVVAGLTRRTVSPEGRVTETGYDAFGRANLTTDSARGTASRIFLPDGRISSSTDETGAETQYHYHPVTRQLVRVQHPDLTSSRYDYDVRGRRTHVWGSAEYPTWTEYDHLDRMIRLHTYRDHTVDFDQETWPVNAGAGDITHWNYDPVTGFLNSKVDASGATTSFKYDYDGLLIRTTLARTVNGQPLTVTYGYDNANRLTSVNYSDNTPDVVRTYFRDGPLSGVTDALGTRSFTRLPTLEPLSEVLTGGAGLYGGITITQSYQNAGDPGPVLPGRWSGLAMNNGYAQSAVYDQQGRLDRLTSGQDVFRYGYLGQSDVVSSLAGVRSGVTNLVRTLGFGVGLRLSSVSNVTPVSTFAVNYPERDLLGRIKRMDQNDGTSWHYQYNDRGEVTHGQKKAQGTVFPGLTSSYAYDPIGNRREVGFGGNAAGTNLTTAVYSRNSLNQYTSLSATDPLQIRGSVSTQFVVRVNATALTSAETLDEPTDRLGLYWRAQLNFSNQSSAVYANTVFLLQNDQNTTQIFPGPDVFVPQAPETFAYDADGNLQSDGRWNYTWDAENRLTGVETRADLPAVIPRHRLSFKYDYLGRRIQKKVETENASTWITTTDQRFVWDDWRLLQRLDATGAIDQEYHWGLDLSGTLEGAGTIGGLLQVRQAAPATEWAAWPLFDGGGNVRGLVNRDGGARLAEYEYDAFGQAVRQVTLNANFGDVALLNPFRHATKSTDDETGLAYYGFRYFNPRHGNWLSADPLELSGGLNLHGFAGNDTVNEFDADGRQTNSISMQGDFSLGGGAVASVSFSYNNDSYAPYREDASIQLPRPVLVPVRPNPVITAAPPGSPRSYDSGRKYTDAEVAQQRDFLTPFGAGHYAGDASGIGEAFMNQIAMDTLAAPGGEIAGSAVNCWLKRAVKNAAGRADDAVALTQEQVANLARFNKKLPAGNSGTAVDTLGDGVLFTSTVPGRVPGSSAVYQKFVDAAGKTISYLKTTFDPRGKIIHIKDKLNGGVIPPN